MTANMADRSELAAKRAVIACSAAEVEACERAHSVAHDELEAVRRGIAAAQTAFDREPNQQNAIDLSLAQHRLPRATAFAEDAAAALVRVRDVHGSSLAELARTEAENTRRTRIGELAAVISGFDAKVAPLAERVMGLVTDLRSTLATAFAIQTETRAAAAELATLTGEVKQPDGVRFALPFLTHALARGVRTTEHELAVFLPRAPDAWLTALVGVVSRMLAAPRSSPAELAEEQALVDAVSSTTTYQDARHRLVLSRLPERPPVDASIVGAPAENLMRRMSSRRGPIAGTRFGR